MVLMSCAGSLLPSCSSSEEERPPNVLLISVDTLRADRLGCYGAPRETSPAIDALAARGVLFEDVTATSPWTLPSHGSLFTGLYPSRHGLKDQEHLLRDDVPTLAETLRGAGYRTHAIVNALYVSERFGLGRGFEEYAYVSEWAFAPDGSRAIVNRGAEVTDQAQAYLEAVEDEPFFLFLHYYDVHTDLSPSLEHRKAFAPGYEGAPSGLTAELLQARLGQRALDERDVQHLRSLYDAEIRTLDDQLARLFTALEASGRADDTLVILTSDHGEEWLEHGSLLHGRTYYQEVIGIPLVVAGPGLPAGRRVSTPVSLVDVAPTVLEEVGLAAIEADGRSLRSTYAGEGGAVAEDRALFAEADHNDRFQGVKVNDVWRMVRRGRWKLKVHRISQERRLFDLEQDPRETRDVAASQPAVVQELATLLQAFEAKAHEGRRAADALSEDERARQRALGY